MHQHRKNEYGSLNRISFKTNLKRLSVKLNAQKDDDRKITFDLRLVIFHEF